MLDCQMHTSYSSIKCEKVLTVLTNHIPIYHNFQEAQNEPTVNLDESTNRRETRAELETDDEGLKPLVTSTPRPSQRRQREDPSRLSHNSQDTDLTDLSSHLDSIGGHTCTFYVQSNEEQLPLPVPPRTGESRVFVEETSSSSSLHIAALIDQPPTSDPAYNERQLPGSTNKNQVSPSGESCGPTYAQPVLSSGVISLPPATERVVYDDVEGFKNPEVCRCN